MVLLITLDELLAAGVNAIGKFITAIGSGAVQLVDKGAQAIVSFLNGVANSIRRYEPQMISAGFNIGSAIVQGMINGVGHLAGSLLAKVGSMITSLPKNALKLLGIHSPSKVFYDIGVQTILGLTTAIDDNADEPANSIENMTQTMVDSMSKVPDALSGMTDFNPVITPVVDLTGVQEGADQMNSIFAETPVIATTSFGQAASISSSQTGQGLADGSTTTEGSVIKFEQNNYSPESLSPTEIYRQTRNQLSQMRTALALA